MKLGIFQFSPIWGNKEQNLRKIEDTIASYSGIDLWVLPELCTTGYQFSSKDDIKELAEIFPLGESSKILLKLSSDIQSAIVVGVMERADNKFFNSAAVFDKGEFIGIYRKVHLFYEEKKWFSPGTETPPVFGINEVKVGVMICFDWIFPEMVRTLALHGAQIIAHPANLVLPYCQNAMITRSIENRVFTATANRIGTEKIKGKQPLTFTGKSQVTDPKGKRIGNLSENEEDVLIVSINPEEALNKMITPYNDVLRDRHPSIYQL